MDTLRDIAISDTFHLDGTAFVAKSHIVSVVADFHSSTVLQRCQISINITINDTRLASSWKTDFVANPPEWPDPLTARIMRGDIKNCVWKHKMQMSIAGVALWLWYVKLSKIMTKKAWWWCKVINVIFMEFPRFARISCKKLH